MHIERIHISHQRVSFSCGKRKMDDFLYNCGLSEAYGSTWVVVPDPEAKEIIAYFTLRPDPQDIVTEQGSDELLTSIVLERLAVDLKYQRQGVGKWLLGYLVRQTVQAAEFHPIDSLVLTPLDDEAKNYYLGLQMGFQPLSPDSNYLAISIETMRDAVSHPV